MKTALYTSALAAALLAGQVCGASAQMTNTVKDGARGSVLVFPLIDVDPLVDTFIEISNDETVGLGGTNFGVNVKCEYVNEKKGRNSFTFFLTVGGSISWDVKTGSVDHGDGSGAPNTFPFGGPFSSNGAPVTDRRGELICVAMDETFTTAIAYNRLYGRATVMNNPIPNPPQTEPKSAFRYNSFNFRAWNNDNLAPDYTVMQGVLNQYVIPIKLPLTGALNSGLVYDACPMINSTPFMPAGAALGNLKTVQNFVSGLGCNQDVTDPFDGNIFTTQLNFIVEDSQENSYDGAQTCVDSNFSFALGPVGSVPYLSNAQNFQFVPTPGAVAGIDARLQVVSLAGCGGTQVGLLSVFPSEIAITTPGTPFPPPGIFDQIVANPTQTVGAMSGFIWLTPGK
jgi:hypothetical protein